MSKLSVAAIQPDLLWLNPQANLNRLSLIIENLPDSIDLIVLPEMFTSGFTQIPESLSGQQQTLQWMQAQAKKYHCALAGSVAYEVEPNDKDIPAFVNRFLFVTPDGECQHYDKWHLFRMAGEHERYQAGKQRCIVEYRGWKIFLSICYDLRFPVFCRNSFDTEQAYDLMLCVANWPSSRRHQWRTLLQARAIENQAYVVGVNRVGVDGNELHYQGDSLITDYMGNLLSDGGDGEEQVLLQELDWQQLQTARSEFPVMQDSDIFKML